MQKILILVFIFMPFFFEFCSSTKKNLTQVKEPVKVTYSANIQHIMLSNCTPCHFPPKGFKKAYDTYAMVREDANDIIIRIQKNPGEPGFMPFKHPKLSDSTIMVIVQWKKDGLLEK